MFGGHGLTGLAGPLLRVVCQEAIGPKDRYTHAMETETTNASLADWSPDQIELGRRWVHAWQTAGPELERVRREELRQLDGLRAVSLLCGPADYRVPPRAPRPTSGLVEQQRWFKKAAGYE